MRMIKGFSRLAVAATLLASSIASNAAGSKQSVPPVDVAAYPALDRVQLGHVRYLVTLADQLDGDWSRMSTLSTIAGFDGYRYQLAFATYTLGMAFNEYTPAYPELYREATDRLIRKMLREDVWGDWYQTSKGIKPLFDPDLTELRPGWYDPVVKQNIMYSGHLLQMINLDEMLYGERKWDKRDSIVFTASANFGPQAFKYDNQDLAAVIYKQFEENGWAGVDCEPNATFPECNQHPILGFEHYDWLHGTDMFKIAAPRFKAVFLAKNYVDPASGSFMFFNQIKQKRIIYAARPWSDGWSGMWMHAWDPAYVETLYPHQRDRHLVKLAGGMATVPLPEQLRNWFSFDFGFFTAYAAEMGDRATRDALLRYADRYMDPTLLDGARYYPRHDEYSADANEERNRIYRKVGPITGNVLLGMARINPGGGLRHLYERADLLPQAGQPYVEGFRYPNVVVRRARYDLGKRAMVVSFEPGRGLATTATWRIHNLDSKARWHVWIDGKPAGVLNPATRRSGILARDGDTLTVSEIVSRPTDLILQLD